MSKSRGSSRSNHCLKKIQKAMYLRELLAADPGPVMALIGLKNGKSVGRHGPIDSRLQYLLASRRAELCKSFLPFLLHPSNSKQCAYTYTAPKPFCNSVPRHKILTFLNYR